MATVVRHREPLCRCKALIPVTVTTALITSICGLVAGEAAEISSGSGVVISTKGEILTNAHVVENCQSITVRLAPGNSEVGVLVASDEKNDLALVRLK
jgi:putative serine protease PepD